MSQVISEKKLVIHTKKFKGDTSTITARIPMTLIERIDDIAVKTGRTRNEIVQKCLEYSIYNIEVE